MQTNWQADFFRGVALEFWRRAMSPEQTRLEADFLEKALGANRPARPLETALRGDPPVQLPEEALRVDAPVRPPESASRANSPARLLDVPCGNGRHAIELAARGYAVTGVDSSEEFLADARTQSAHPIRWVQSDMCDLPWSQEFDGAYCAGNSFCYLDYDKAIQFLSAIAAALKPGGRFVMDTGMAAEAILPALGKGWTREFGDITVASSNRYEPRESRLDIDYTFTQNGHTETRPLTSYCFTSGDICRMHREAGLEVVDLFDWYSNQPFQLGSRGLVVASRRSGFSLTKY